MASRLGVEERLAPPHAFEGQHHGCGEERTAGEHRVEEHLRVVRQLQRGVSPVEETRDSRHARLEPDPDDPRQREHRGGGGRRQCRAQRPAVQKRRVNEDRE